MTIKEKVLEVLDALGFKVKQLEDDLYSFDFEGWQYWYLPSEDESFLNITIPGFCELDEENTMAYLELEDKLNAALEFVKVYKMSGYLWLVYERELMGEEDLQSVIAHMIARLESARYKTQKIMEAQEASEEDHDEGTVEEVEHEEEKE